MIDDKDRNDETLETSESKATSQADDKVSDEDLDAAAGGRLI